MASITTRPAGAGTSILSRVFGKLAARSDARSTRASLSKLTDYQLYDLGLVRSDIDEIADRITKR